MAWIINPPPNFDLPLSLGGDLKADFVYKPLVVDGSGNPILDGNGNLQYAVANYPDGATVTVTIDATPAPIVADATISGSNATVLIPSAECDTCVDLQLWRCTLTYADGYNQVIVNGQVFRSDGIPLGTQT